MRKKILLTLFCSILLLNVTGCDKNKNKDVAASKEDIISVENLNVEVNSKVMLLSLISNPNKLEIISENKAIDTSKIGEQELIVQYKKDNEIKDYKFTIMIKDSTVPVIEYSQNLSTTVGTKINLLKNVKVTDNSKEKIKATVEGKYDFNKAGTYTLKYVASDSSNNKAEEKFTLKVVAKKTSSSNKTTSTVNSGSTKKEAINSEKVNSTKNNDSNSNQQANTSTNSKSASTDNNSSSKQSDVKVTTSTAPVITINTTKYNNSAIHFGLELENSELTDSGNIKKISLKYYMELIKDDVDNTGSVDLIVTDSHTGTKIYETTLTINNLVLNKKTYKTFSFNIDFPTNDIQISVKK